MRKKMRKMMHKIMRKIASMRKTMRKIISMRKTMRKMMRKTAFMRNMMRKMEIQSSEREYSRSEQQKPFKCHLMAQNVYCQSNQATSFQNWAYQVSEKNANKPYLQFMLTSVLCYFYHSSQCNPDCLSSTTNANLGLTPIFTNVRPMLYLIFRESDNFTCKAILNLVG